ncbi:MAG: hypothetical protein JXA93_09575 [Anaerolineae bacterium]|nr:hypothetical protein [Anaerolineae bacterium]
MEHNLAVDVLGWVGAAALLSAYGLVSTKRLDGDSVRYQGLNLAGAGLLIVNSLYYGAYPSVGVNAVWIGIGLLALWRVRRVRGRKSDTETQ